MYVVIAGGGKVGANLARTLIERGHEVTLIENHRDRYLRLDHEFDYRVHLGDATELFVLERAGLERPPDLVLAVTGDDEDNIIICQLAREKYGVPKLVARVNDPRNQAHFDLLGIAPTVCATSDIMAKVEHEVPGMADLIHLLELQQENLELIEVEIDANSPAAGKAIETLDLPTDSRLVLVSRNGQAEIAVGSTRLQAGDRVMAILQTGKEDEVRRILLSSKSH
jgi:trk system potassium uptake protein TrkA